MERRLHAVVVLGTIFVSFAICQNEIPQPSKCFAMTAATVEFNSLQFRESAYTKQNVAKVCYSKSYWRTVEGVESLMACATEAYASGMNSFSYENGVCEVSSFHVALESTDVLERTPSDNTDAVFIAFPPVNESAAGDQIDGILSMELTSSEFISEKPVMIVASSLVSGRLCLVRSFQWVGEMAGSDEEISGMIDWDGERSSNFTIETTIDLCRFRNIYVNFVYDHLNGSSSENKTSLRLPNEDDQTEEIPFVDILTSEFISEKPVKISGVSLVSGRLCLVRSFEWVGEMTGSDEEVSGMIDWDGEQLSNFTIETTIDLCKFSAIYVNLAYEHFNGTSSESKAFLKSPNENALSFEVLFLWRNLANNTNATQLIAGVLIDQATLTEVKFFVGETSFSNITDIGENGVISPEMFLPRDNFFYDTVVTVEIYGENGCLVMTQVLTQRSVCDFEYDEMGTKINGAADDYYNRCALTYGNASLGMPSFEEAQEHCAARKLKRSMDSLSLLKVDDEKSMNILKHVMNESSCNAVWSSFKRINNTWQWPDGDTEINETYIDAFGFGSSSDYDCSQFKAPDNVNDPPLLEIVHCSFMVACVVCTAPVMGGDYYDTSTHVETMKFV